MVRHRSIFSVKFSADANFVLSGSDDTNIRIWKAEASKSLAKVRLRVDSSIVVGVPSNVRFWKWLARVCAGGSSRAPQARVQRVAQGALPAPARDQPHRQVRAARSFHALEARSSHALRVLCCLLL